ncbi:MAG: hypothetical protein H6621_00090 [Halobacteriovoraceae bacterium]|nr:hypothetical protein [Halobacteriovoraceae bacterium]MCB9093439.1 hypothetical protein [Halobacteriovoraceae bacterium]
MFSNIVEVAKDIHAEMLTVYWILIAPLVVLLIILEFFKGEQENPNVEAILKRAVISMLLLFSLNFVINTIGMIGDGIVGRIDKITNVWDVLKNLGPNYENSSGDWFNLRENILYAIAVLAYLIAYLGFFVAEALTHFVWVVLFVVSPLMILAYIPNQTASITGNLYKGLIKVIVWKVLWTVLGALLLKLAMNPQFTGLEDYLMAIVLNLCIGLSMLFIPIATRSLINDGMEGAASAIAAVPTMATATAIKSQAAKWMNKGGRTAKDGLGFASKPLTNPITGRAKIMSQKLQPRLEKMKHHYSEINLPKEAKELKENEKRRSNARRYKKGR